MTGPQLLGKIPSSWVTDCNSDYIHFRPHEDRNFVTLSRKMAVNQDAVVIPLYFMGNLTMSNASLQGVICA